MDLYILLYSVIIWAIAYVLIRVVREKRKHNWRVVEKRGNSDKRDSFQRWVDAGNSKDGDF